MSSNFGFPKETRPGSVAKHTASISSSTSTKFLKDGVVQMGSYFVVKVDNWTFCDY
uniref:Uncharacterized protein n=1 Tax=Arundo donax TaxID=35708 RepID=A0A0A9FUB7_ARUDO